MKNIEMYQFEKVPKVAGHNCRLYQEDDLVGLYVYGGVLVNFHRKFREFFMVDPADPQAKSVLKSSAQIRAEETRHLKNYFYMIHPFSEGRKVWETIMIVVYTAQFVLMPMELAVPKTEDLVVYSKFFCDVMSYIDIILFFCTGYYCVELRKIILNPRKVFRHYLFTYFIFDIMSSLPYNMYIRMTSNYDLHNLKYFYIFKLVRLPTFLNYVQMFLIRLEIWSYKLTRLNFFLCLAILIWWSSAITFKMFIVIHKLPVTYFFENPDLFTPTMDSCYQVVKAFMLVSISKIYTDTLLSSSFNLFCLLMGSVLNMVILGQVLQIYESRSGSRNRYNDLMQQLSEYMKYKEMPNSLRNRVFRFVEFKFQKNIFKEGNIVLSRLLRQEVSFHNCKKMVERVEFFRELPNHLILQITSKLKSEIYLPNDIIVQAGYPGQSMYFIFVGTVAVYTTTGKEICHLEDGGNFGEISLVINEPRVASVIAVTDCEVFRLSRKDFSEALKAYPALYGKMKISALARLRATQMVMNQELLQRGISSQN